MPQWVRPDPNAAPLLRLPLAVSPILRLPLHASLGMMLGIGPVNRGLGRLAAQGWPITYLLHGLDLSAPEDLFGRLPAPLAASRAFNTPLDRKLQFIEEVLGHLQSIARPQLTVDYLSDRIMR